MMKHVPVLLSSVLDMLGDIKNRTVVDCTFGAGGYTRAFLERGAKVIAFDRDTNVVSDAMAIKKEFGDKLGEQDVLVSALCTYAMTLQKMNYMISTQAQQRIAQLEAELAKKIKED